MVWKKVIFISFILIVSCGINKDKNSTEAIVLCFINNLNEIEKKISFEDIGHDYRSYWRIEEDFFKHLRELITTKIEFNENTFLEKYNKLINNIPKGLDSIFLDYPEIGENGYKHYIDNAIHTQIIIFENFKDITVESSVKIDLENINKINIDKIKFIFHNDGINDILNKNKKLLIKKINNYN
jgi:hypothetical protein